MKKISRLFWVLCIVFSGIVLSGNANAQCPMCHIATESNLANGGSAGKGLNFGILYMLALPYTLVCTFGLIWYVNSRRQEEDDVDILS